MPVIQLIKDKKSNKIIIEIKSIAKYMYVLCRPMFYLLFCVFSFFLCRPISVCLSFISACFDEQTCS